MGLRRRILAYGLRTDPHIALVADRLRTRGVETLYFDPTRTEECAFALDGGGSEVRLTALAGDDTVALSLPADDVLVWVRNKAIKPVIRTQRHQDSYFRITERSSFLRGLVAAYQLPHLNDLAASIRHEDKLLQLAAAQAVGFTVPATLVSNDRAEVLAFLHAHGGDAVMKALRTIWIPRGTEPDAVDRVIMTQSVSYAEVDGATPAEIRDAPAIYQRRIEKQFECRVAASRSGAVFYRIELPPAGDARLDWRRSYEDCAFARMPPVAAISECIEAYLHRVGLHFGVFDFIVDPTDAWHFLECNSDGQWAWLGDGCPEIAGLISDMLTEGDPLAA